MSKELKPKRIGKYHHNGNVNTAYTKHSVVDVVRCNNCKWFSNDTECKNCADIDDPCGYCRYFGACVPDDGYCYRGEMTEITSERK